jgi:hypothetical protein
MKLTTIWVIMKLSTLFQHPRGSLRCLNNIRLNKRIDKWVVVAMPINTARVEIQLREGGTTPTLMATVILTPVVSQVARATIKLRRPNCSSSQWEVLKPPQETMKIE